MHFYPKYSVSLVQVMGWGIDLKYLAHIMHIQIHQFVNCLNQEPTLIPESLIFLCNLKRYKWQGQIEITEIVVIYKMALHLIIQHENNI